MHFSLQDHLIWLVWWLFKAHVFKTRSGSCAAFLANYDASSSATVTFGNNQYDLPPWSVSILPDCKSVIFNTAKVRKDSNHLDKTFLCSYGYANVTFKTIQNLKFNCLNIFSLVKRMKNLMRQLLQVGAPTSQPKMTPVSSFSWLSYNEETASAYTEDTTTMAGLVEQISVTRDSTDYLWYMTE